MEKGFIVNENDEIVGTFERRQLYGAIRKLYIITISNSSYTIPELKLSKWLEERNLFHYFED